MHAAPSLLIEPMPRAESSADEAIAIADAWLASKGRAAFEFQHEAWRAYIAGESGLINAPTGTGKTLAAWLGPVLAARCELDGQRSPQRAHRAASASDEGPRAAARAGTARSPQSRSTSGPDRKSTRLNSS